MTKTTFVNGTVVTPVWLNAQQNIVFDGQDLDGHYSKITNSDLSTDAGQILPEWQAFRDTFKVTASTGLSIAYQGGSVTLPSGVILAIAPGTLSVTASTTNYVFINRTGSVQSSTTRPLFGIILAEITTSTNAVTGIVDARPRYQILPKASAIKIFGGTGDEGDAVISVNTALERGEYYYQNLTINGGVNVTCTSGQLTIYCSETFTLNGTITVSAPSIGGGYTLAPALVAHLTGGESGSGYGAGRGEASGQTYSWLISRVGSGGSAGYVVAQTSASAWFPQTKGGNGGGVLIVEAKKIVVNGSVICVGTAGGNGTNDGNIRTGGAGGGSGGGIILRAIDSITVAPAASLDVRGGGGGGAPSGTGESGSGGGGGWLVFQSPSTNTSGATLTVSGGAAGSGGATGQVPFGGAGGSFAGLGGSQAGNGAAGASGQILYQSFVPIA
ncbi:MAG: hypothetical protein KME52_28370 [Desmonostoc geniculatum HA4340-LM1]|jgi:hypothetical protein|nr:hypothetical protein [Desmonostoc geniculatum HA4340-LM1]